MRARKLCAGLLVTIALAWGTACQDLTSPNFNAGDVNDLLNDPDRSDVAAAAQGLLIGSRSYVANIPTEDPFQGYVDILGTLGRNSYNLFAAELRHVTELLAGSLNPGSEAFGGNIWRRPYENVKIAEIILGAVDKVPADQLTAGEREAVRGFAKTFKALDLLHVLNTRDVNCDGNLGCPVDIPDDPDQLAPAVAKGDMFDALVRLLEEARGHLEGAGGAAFPFGFSDGFDGFDTPPTFLRFNRALLGRILVYMCGEFDAPASCQAALDALGDSFLDTAAPLDLGVYHAFGTGSGDAVNGLFQPGEDPDIRAHPSVVTDAERKPDGTLDDRVVRKTRPIQARQVLGVGSDIGFSIYDGLTVPIPIIRNEELILLRAEANILLGNLDAARQDIDFIRQTSGGLPPVGPFADADQALDQLLYEKRYSLLFEGGHRWIDLRRHGRIEELPLDQPDHRRNVAFPIPEDEALAR